MGCLKGFVNPECCYSSVRGGRVLVLEKGAGNQLQNPKPPARSGGNTQVQILCLLKTRLSSGFPREILSRLCLMSFSCVLSVVARAPAPAEAGGAAEHTALLTQDEQRDVLEHLDLVLRNVSELRREVEELRHSLQQLAADIIGEVRSDPAPFCRLLLLHRVSLWCGKTALGKFKEGRWEKCLWFPWACSEDPMRSG